MNPETEPFKTIPCALTIAGSDSGGGAGIQADLKTFTSLDVYGMTVITAVTAQNTLGVQGISITEASMVSKQLESVLSDIRPQAIKTGMLPTSKIIETISKQLRPISSTTPIIVDPVLIATSGDKLVSSTVVKSLISDLFPIATLVTPNIPEAQVICGGGIDIRNIDDVRKTARTMVHGLGCKAVLIKGGHLEDAFETAVDVLYDGNGFEAFASEWVETKNTHGTGCTLGAAIAAGMAKGLSVKQAVKMAKQYVWEGLVKGRELQIGKGNGPLYHMHTVGRFINEDGDVKVKRED